MVEMIMTCAKLITCLEISENLLDFALHVRVVHVLVVGGELNNEGIG